jgi:hypothetical protein
VVASNYDGQKVTYIDPLKIVHTGVIVGQTDDGKWQLVQSDNPAVPPADWHFRIATDKISAFLKH